MFSIVVAMGKKNEIGKNNDLLWRISEDLKKFKQLTTGSKIIMGRNTFQSLKKPLPNRENIVLSRTLKKEEEKKLGITIFNSLDEVLNLYKSSEKEIFIIGGAQIYTEFLPYVNKMYISLIDETLPIGYADTFFPEFKKNDWLISNRESYSNWEFFVYERKL